MYTLVRIQTKALVLCIVVSLYLYYYNLDYYEYTIQTTYCIVTRISIEQSEQRLSSPFSRLPL